MKRAVPIFGLAAFALAGCVKFGEKPPPTLMVLSADAPRAADTAGTGGQGTTLMVLPPEAPRMLATDRLVVRTSATTIAYLENARWSDQPAKLFSDVLAETIAARTGRIVIDRRQYALSPGARLTGRLNGFELDTTRGEVVVNYDAAFAPGDGKPLLARRFEARLATPSEKPDAVARALNQAANQVAVQVADWIGK